MTYNTRRSQTHPPEPRRTRSLRNRKAEQSAVTGASSGTAVTNHAALYNLDYDDADHTNFASLHTEQTFVAAKLWTVPYNKTAIEIQYASGQTADGFKITTTTRNLLVVDNNGLVGLTADPDARLTIQAVAPTDADVLALPNLWAWWDAADPNGDRTYIHSLNDGDAIAQLKDKTANARHLTTNTAGDRPLWKNTTSGTGAHWTKPNSTSGAYISFLNNKYFDNIGGSNAVFSKLRWTIFVVMSRVGSTPSAHSPSIIMGSRRLHRAYNSGGWQGWHNCMLRSQSANSEAFGYQGQFRDEVSTTPSDGYDWYDGNPNGELAVFGYVAGKTVTGNTDPFRLHAYAKIGSYLQDTKAGPLYFYVPQVCNYIDSETSVSAQWNQPSDGDSNLWDWSSNLSMVGKLETGTDTSPGTEYTDNFISEILMFDTSIVSGSSWGVVWAYLKNKYNAGTFGGVVPFFNFKDSSGTVRATCSGNFRLGFNVGSSPTALVDLVPNAVDEVVLRVKGVASQSAALAEFRTSTALITTVSATGIITVTPTAGGTAPFSLSSNATGKVTYLHADTVDGIEFAAGTQYRLAYFSTATQISPLGGAGTTTQVLHGNAAGAPSFGSVVEADLGFTDVTTANSSTTAHGLLPKLPGSAEKYLGGDGAWYDLPIGASWYLTDAASDLAGYKALSPTVPTEAEAYVDVEITGTDTTIEEWAAVAIETPRFLSAQVMHVHLHAHQSAGTKTVQVRAKFYHRTSGGTETQIGVTEYTPNLTGSATGYDLSIAVPDTAFAATDRGVMKVFGTQGGAGTNPFARITYRGTTYSRVEGTGSIATTPAAHASTHNPGGSDVVVGGIVQISDTGSTINTNAALGNVFQFTLGSNSPYTLAAPSNPVDGQKCVWRFHQDGTGSRTLTVATGSTDQFRFGTDVTGFTPASAANSVSLMGAIYNLEDRRWDVVTYSRGY